MTGLEQLAEHTNGHVCGYAALTRLAAYLQRSPAAFGSSNSQIDSNLSIIFRQYRTLDESALNRIGIWEDYSIKVISLKSTSKLVKTWPSTRSV